MKQAFFNAEVAERSAERAEEIYASLSSVQQKIPFCVFCAPLGNLCVEKIKPEPRWTCPAYPPATQRQSTPIQPDKPDMGLLPFTRLPRADGGAV
jgi:hypothetical protein